MAGDSVYNIKVVVYPYQELDKKKLGLMTAKEIGLDKKPKNFQFADKMTVTSVKWDKKKIEDAVRAVFRYDLSLLAAQIWQQYQPVEKAKNGQDKMKLANKLLKEVPKLIKATEKKLAQSFAEFKEDLESGAGDDIGQLKSSRKALTAGHPEAMLNLISDFLVEFEKPYLKLLKLKKTEQKSSGEAKEKAAKEFEDMLNAAIPALQKSLDAKYTVLKKRIAVLAGIPAAMKKSMAKDVSDGAKAEFKASMDLLAKAVPPVAGHLPKFQKSMTALLQKMRRKDVSTGSLDQAEDVATKLANSVLKLEESMKKIDAKLKKLEQTAKKR